MSLEVQVSFRGAVDNSILIQDGSWDKYMYNCTFPPLKLTVDVFFSGFAALDIFLMVVLTFFAIFIF